MRLVLMGPPGAGKSTQARSVAEHFKVPAISTGELLRAHVAEGTLLGTEARRFMDTGEYLPDDVTNRMVRNRLGESDAERGFVLDGYPRTLTQLAELDRMIAATGHRLDAAVALTLDEDEIVRRLLERAQLEHRDDDTEAVIRRRHQVYVEQTIPLIEVYRDRGILVEVAGSGEPDDVTWRILDALDGAPRAI